jgi:hypothetical protein
MSTLATADLPVASNKQVGERGVAVCMRVKTSEPEVKTNAEVDIYFKSQTAA